MIRPFTLKDLPTMVELGKIMHEESVYRDLDFDAQKLIDLGHHYIANPETCWSAVAEVDGRIIGMYAGYITEYYFGKDLIAQDLLLFVDPTKRGGLAAVKLITAFEDWAFAKGVKEVCPASSTMVAPERTAMLYNLLGYTNVGSLFKKRR